MYLLQHSHADDLPHDQTFFAVNPVVSSAHLPLTRGADGRLCDHDAMIGSSESPVPGQFVSGTGNDSGTASSTLVVVDVVVYC